MQTNPIISVENVTVGYGQTVILEDVSFEIQPGQVFGILGGSGCGKSTLMRHMIGLSLPLKGRVLINGKDLTHAAKQEKEQILQSIGVSFQSGALFGSLTLQENVRLPLEEFTKLPDPLVDLIASLKLRQVGLAGYEDYLPAELSGGMQKRAAVARAMALEPKILFLDEPSAGLDPITSAELDQLILKLSKELGITFILVTHELESIFTIADRIIMLDKKQKGIIAAGSPQDLKQDRSNETVWQFFNREPSMENIQKT